MATQPNPDRNVDFMMENWGTNKLITDYHSIQTGHNLIRQTKIHEKIRNDDDYDDWDYGTEPTYGKSW